MCSTVPPVIFWFEHLVDKVGVKSGQIKKSVLMTTLFLTQWVMGLLYSVDVSVNERVPTLGGLHTM